MNFSAVNESKQTDMLWDRNPRSSEFTCVSVYKFVAGLHLWNGMAKNSKSNPHPQAL